LEDKKETLTTLYNSVQRTAPPVILGHRKTKSEEDLTKASRGTVYMIIQGFLSYCVNQWQQLRGCP